MLEFKRGAALAIIATTLFAAACGGPPSERWLAGSFLRCEEAEDGTRRLFIDGERIDRAEARWLIQRLNEIGMDRHNDPPHSRTHYIRASWFIEDCLEIEVNYVLQ